MARATTIKVSIDDDAILDSIATLELIRDTAHHRIESLLAELRARQRRPFIENRPGCPIHGGPVCFHGKADR